MATLTPLKRKRGPAYRLSYRDPATGKYRRKTIWASKADADIILKRVESKIALGEYDIEFKRPRSYTWDQMVERYIPHSRRKNSGKTVKREQQVINAFSAFLNGNTLLLDIKKPTI